MSASSVESVTEAIRSMVGEIDHRSLVGFLREESSFGK